MAVVSMTSGNVQKHLIAYTIPLVLGNLFQLMYNVVDSVIAGRFIGKEALAAAGVANPVMSIVILSISGVCVGSSVLMSEFFGAGDEKKLKSEMATSVLFGLYFSLAVAALGFLLAQPLLKLIRVPAELLPLACAYLRIIFLGTPFTYFYNALAASLKSIGDSRTPLRFLMISSVLNAVLDIIFIGVLGFGIVCSATTTVIAEGVSAALSMWHVTQNVPVLRLKRSEWKIDPKLLKQTLHYGSVTALQQSVQPIAKLLIQGAVNPLGVDVIAAFNAAERVDEFALLPERSMGQSMTTFVAQNRGAGRMDRVKEGFFKGMRLEILYGATICFVLLVLKEPLMRLFVANEGNEVLIAHGVSYLTLMAFFYLPPAVTNGVQGFFRGMGNVRMNLKCTLLQTSLRVLFTYLLTPIMGISGIAIACAVGWGAMILYEIPSSLKTIRGFSKADCEKVEKIQKNA